VPWGSTSRNTQVWLTLSASWHRDVSCHYLSVVKYKYGHNVTSMNEWLCCRSDQQPQRSAPLDSLAQRLLNRTETASTPPLPKYPPQPSPSGTQQDFKKLLSAMHLLSSRFDNAISQSDLQAVMNGVKEHVRPWSDYDVQSLAACLCKDVSCAAWLVRLPHLSCTIQSEGVGKF
jgi:hypothetical protein